MLYPKNHLPPLGLFIGLILSTAVFAQSSIDEGIALFEDGKVNEAKGFFEDFIKTNKKHPEANFYMGRIYFDEDEFGDAIDWLEKAANYESGNSKYYMWLGHSYGRRAQNAGKLKQAFYARDSRKNYEKSVELDPDNVEARESVMEFYLQAPGFMGGGRDKAENQAQAIMNLDKEAGYMAWGRIYSYYDEDDKVFENYTQAVQEFPSAMGPYYELFSYYFNRQEYEKAAEMARKQLTVNDTTAVVYYNLGNALQWGEVWSESIEAYQKALEIEPEFYNTWYQIGRLAAVSGNYESEGEEYLIKLISLDDPLNDNTLAWSHFRLGTIYESKQNLEAAEEQYKAALKKDKDHEQAKEALDRLK
ncbi:MAG: tetratricopeptide repeat protein [Balneolaceae bacterium]|nr:tetratricopeptide repeat protein [Balneolaceae bacterium]MBO6545372.1 tetratricopeptide repeat protein [Balneolaceae bacterium]MBO6646768.1 tetratricopeptide repeat protein [Balneolaceae bacterium]